jgi:hypothetical protein
VALLLAECARAGHLCKLRVTGCIVGLNSSELVLDCVVIICGGAVSDAGVP